MSRDVIITAISTFGLVGCVSFIIAYHRRSGGDWRHNEVGIWLMISRVNLGLIFGLLITGRVFGDFWLREYFIIFLVFLFALQTYWPSKFIWRYPTGIERRADDKETSSDTRT